jgi:hypothetical protein
MAMTLLLEIDLAGRGIIASTPRRLECEARNIARSLGDFGEHIRGPERVTIEVRQLPKGVSV